VTVVGVFVPFFLRRFIPVVSPRVLTGALLFPVCSGIGLYEDWIPLVSKFLSPKRFPLLP
jgi:hypothetical protein